MNNTPYIDSYIYKRFMFSRSHFREFIGLKNSDCNILIDFLEKAQTRKYSNDNQFYFRNDNTLYLQAKMDSRDTVFIENPDKTEPYHAGIGVLHNVIRRIGWLIHEKDFYSEIQLTHHNSTSSSRLMYHEDAFMEGTPSFLFFSVLSMKHDLPSSADENDISRLLIGTIPHKNRICMFQGGSLDVYMAFDHLQQHCGTYEVKKTPLHKYCKEFSDLCFSRGWMRCNINHYCSSREDDTDNLVTPFLSIPDQTGAGYIIKQHANSDEKVLVHGRTERGYPASRISMVIRVYLPEQTENLQWPQLWHKYYGAKFNKKETEEPPAFVEFHH